MGLPCGGSYPAAGSTPSVQTVGVRGGAWGTRACWGSGGSRRSAVKGGDDLSGLPLCWGSGGGRRPAVEGGDHLSALPRRASRLTTLGSPPSMSSVAGIPLGIRTVLPTTGSGWLVIQASASRTWTTHCVPGRNASGAGPEAPKVRSGPWKGWSTPPPVTHSVVGTVPTQLVGTTLMEVSAM